MMHSASFRFYANLNDFLHRRDAHRRFHYAFWGNPAIKDAIEAIGPPHTEIDLVLVNGRSTAFDYALQDGDRVSVYPGFSTLNISMVTEVRPVSLTKVNFVLDTHLGRLATYLRMLGFDSLYRNDYADEELARLSALEGRILLTKDRGLLKRNEVQHGYCVRQREPRRQLVEILAHFKLSDSLNPFTRCMPCNQILKSVSADDVRSRIPERIFQSHHRFHECPGCDRVYWRGSHHARMGALIEAVIDEASMAPVQEPSISASMDD